MSPLTPDDTVDNELLDRYIAGDCLPHEAQRVQRWLSEQPVMRTVVAELRAEHVSGAPSIVEANRSTIAQDWERVAAVMNGTVASIGGASGAGQAHDILNSGARRDRQKSRRGGLHHRTTRWSRHTLTITTVVAVAMFAVLAGVRMFTSDTSASSAVHASRTFVTRAGERATVNLADGSYVMLGPSSTLTVTQAFGQNSRVLGLRGSGYFSVAQHARIPFVVDAGRARVEVLGTSFGVRSYPEESDVMVAVRTGRVAIIDTIAVARQQRGEARPPLIASANDVARIDPSGATITRRGDEANEMLAWTEGRLVFRDVPLRMVLAELSRWHNVSFRVTDPALQSLPISGGFSNQSITELSDALSFILPVKVVRTGRVFTIAPRE